MSNPYSATGSGAVTGELNADARAFGLAIFGAALLFIGTFLPFLTASAVSFDGSGGGASQSWNLWTDNSGIILTILAAGSVALGKAKLYIGLFITSGLALIDILYERSTIISAKNSLLGAFVHLDIGFAFWLLLLGAALVFIGGVLGKRGTGS